MLQVCTPVWYVYLRVYAYVNVNVNVNVYVNMYVAYVGTYDRTYARMNMPSMIYAYLLLTYVS